MTLGCAMPGERPSIFGDALRRLTDAATYLYRDGKRYWYSTQPTVAKLAEDRAEQLARDSDQVEQEIGQRLKSSLTQRGDFSRIHALPQSSHDIPDEREARLVVLNLQDAYSKGDGNRAEAAAKAILESRGNAPRLYRNTLVFLAADKTRLQELDHAVRNYLAWESILKDREALDLSPLLVKQAEDRRDSASDQVTARLPETYRWLLVPVQGQPAVCAEMADYPPLRRGYVGGSGQREASHRRGAYYAVCRHSPENGTGSCSLMARRSWWM